MMTGLTEYISKHGNHFTVDLSVKASEYLSNICGDSSRCSPEFVNECLDGKVYYNITHSTLGDIVYMVNLAYANLYPKVLKSKSKCLDYALAMAEGVDCYEGTAFCSWVTGMEIREHDFDFTEYI